MRFLTAAALVLMQVSSAHTEVPSLVPSESQIEDLTEALQGNRPLGATESKPARTLQPLAIAMIKDFERWKPGHYDDPSGYCTIGYGHLIAKQRCAEVDLNEFANSLSPEEGEALLLKDTLSARRAVQRLVRIDTSDDQFGALTSFVFNIGKGNFASSHLLELLNDGDLKAAAKQFGRWIVSNHIVLNGLIIRRNCEAMMFREEMTFSPPSAFDRDLCSALGAAPGVGPLINIEDGSGEKP